MKDPPEKRWFKGVVVQIAIALVTLLFVLLLPITILVVFCFYIFRCSLKVFVKCFKPEFGNMVTIRSTIFATDFPDRNTLTSIVVPVVFKGSIDINQLRASIKNKLNQKRENGTFMYPELQQSLSSICGYRFWKWDKSFDIMNHVHLGYGKIRALDEDGLNQVTAKLLRKSFGRRSPWEVYLFPEYNKRSDVVEKSEQKCIILIRLTHCLADGFSIIEMVSEAAKHPVEALNSSYKPSKLEIFKMALYRIFVILLAPYELTSAFIAASDQNLFEAKDNKDSKPLVVRFSDPISIQLVKDLKNKLKTSFEAILVAAYTGGIRKFMLENNMDIPASLHSVIPVPVYGRREKLRNYIKYSRVEFPVGVTDSDTRLRLISTQCAADKVSRLPEQLYNLSLAVGVFPIFAHRLISRSFRLTGVTSNLVSPFQDIDYGTQRAVDCMFAIGLHHGHTWFGISCLTFEGNLRIQSNFIESIASNGKLDAFRDGILNEIQDLANRHLV